MSRKTERSPTWAWILWIFTASMDLSIVHVGKRPQMSISKLAMIRSPETVSSTSGWNWRP